MRCDSKGEPGTKDSRVKRISLKTAVKNLSPSIVKRGRQVGKFEFSHRYTAMFSENRTLVILKSKMAFFNWAWQKVKVQPCF